ncbi:hypothetical protein AAG570_012778 [Ranatra chinensis]|uniref:Bardet-Biedl syndrome 1 N-terminal domain-containing protein n=1 Tax=Ranatra chinensis TaxID=642074 RepID=A0ABD0YFF4_9HEMI
MQQPWIDAYSDPKADIQTFSSCLALADLNADGDFKLILADFGNGTNTKLKVFKGTSMSVELPLISPPSAITTLYTEKGEPHIPDIVVASGSSVLVYRNCRPYFKFSLPAQDCSSLEADLWQQKSQTNYNQLVQLLQELSIELGFSNLSPSSQKLLSIEPHLREDFLNKCNVSLQKQMVITCVATINKNIPDEKDVSCLLLGTESGQLYVMDPETFTLINSFLLTGIPYIICATGVYLIEYRIIFTCRNGSIYLLKSGNIRYICQLSSLPVSMVLVSRNIVITSMDCTLQSISMKGRKQWSVSLPGNVTCMTAMPLTGLALNLIAVALDNGAVHLYNGAQLCYAFNMSDHISSMIFGQYGREEHALVSISSSGAIGIKLLKRTAQFKNDRMDSTNDIHHGIKLLIPKKSKLIVEQTLRERQQCKG